MITVTRLNLVAPLLSIIEPFDNLKLILNLLGNKKSVLHLKHSIFWPLEHKSVLYFIPYCNVKSLSFCQWNSVACLARNGAHIRFERPNGATLSCDVLAS